MTCGWLRISLGKSFWLSSNRSTDVGPKNGVDASEAAGAGGGEGRVLGAAGSGTGDVYGARYRYGSGAGDVAHAGTTGVGAPFCEDFMLLYKQPQD